MRWSIIRLIFCRELRDQLRDRRTIFMIAVLPVLLYPVLGVAVLQFAVGFGDKPSVVGISGSQYLATSPPNGTGPTPLRSIAWLALTPARSSIGLPVDAIAGALAFHRATAHLQAYPPLLDGSRFADAYFEHTQEARTIRVELLPDDGAAALEHKQVDLLLLVPAIFQERLETGNRATLRLVYRDGDERSRLAAKRLYGVLGAWKRVLREVRLERLGISADYDEPFNVWDSERAKASDQLAAEGLLDMLVRIFPFLLVMWALAGALYPAVDLCAGEKERGTMETLLISPASREEIVWGKFLTIWLFSAVTALLNLASMGVTATCFSGHLTHDVLHPAAVCWSVLLALPLSAFFSAVCLAIGAYARSSKEGQYYLMPLFVLTLPLIFLTLVPGVELNPLYSLVPVTGVALLLQRLMTASLDKVPWLYFVPVLAPIVLYSWLALRWAIEQFKREEVLFREAERLEIRLWVRRLFREKEMLPSAGQALFCFALIVVLRWFSFGIGSHRSLMASTAITYLAFVTAPPLFMALLLTTRPRQGLALHLPGVSALLLAALLAGLMLPPLAEVTLSILHQFPMLKELLSERQPLVSELRSITGSADGHPLDYLLVFVLLPAICEELAFRGFILNGLRSRLHPWTAILISSFLFAIYHLNVFQALPAFVLGVVLGMLVVRSGSVLPAMLFHLLYNGLLVGVALLPQFGYSEEGLPTQSLHYPIVPSGFALLATVILVAIGRKLGERRTETELGGTP
jgi:sodium transport system permease protein